MPYIEQHRRLDALQFPRTSGELNYALTKLCLGYISRTSMNYQSINDCLGALEGCKLELYRRQAAPYEDNKIIENGDVYE